MFVYQWRKFANIHSCMKTSALSLYVKVGLLYVGSKHEDKKTKLLLGVGSFIHVDHEEEMSHVV